MKNFVKWWWDKHSESDKHFLASAGIYMSFGAICIGMITLILIDWRILCLGSVFLYGAGLTAGGMFTALIGYDKWTEYEQEWKANEEKQKEKTK